MSEALQQVLDLFRAKGWKFEVDAENEAVRTGIEGDNGSWRVTAWVDDDIDVFLMVSVFPQNSPERRRASCAELLTRINFGMCLEAFEMKCDTGQIHFKTTFPFSKSTIDPEILNNIFMLNLGRMDQFLPAIMSVIYAGISPAKALAAVERQARARSRSRMKPSIEQEDFVCRRFMNN